jgi:hypothetical protein
MLFHPRAGALWVRHLFADGAYDRRKLIDKAAFKAIVVEIVSTPIRASRFYRDAGSSREPSAG